MWRRGIIHHRILLDLVVGRDFLSLGGSGLEQSRLWWRKKRNVGCHASRIHRSIVGSELACFVLEWSTCFDEVGPRQTEVCIINATLSIEPIRAGPILAGSDASRCRYMVLSRSRRMILRITRRRPKRTRTARSSSLSALSTSVSFNL